VLVPVGGEKTDLNKLVRIEDLPKVGVEAGVQPGFADLKPRFEALAETAEKCLLGALELKIVHAGRLCQRRDAASTRGFPADPIVSTPEPGAIFMKFAHHPSYAEGSGRRATPSSDHS